MQPRAMAQRLKELCTWWLNADSWSAAEFVEIVALEQFHANLPPGGGERLRLNGPMKPIGLENE